MPSFIYLLYNAHKIGKITREVFLIACMGMSLALPFLVNLKLAYLIISIIEIRCKGYKILVKLICNISTVCYFFIINNEHWFKLTMLFAPNSVNHFPCFFTVTFVFHKFIKVIL